MSPYTIAKMNDIKIVVASPKGTRPCVTLMNKEKLYRLGYHREVDYALHEETATTDYFTLVMSPRTARAFLQDLPHDFYIDYIMVKSTGELIYNDKPYNPPPPMYDATLYYVYWLASGYKKTRARR